MREQIVKNGCSGGCCTKFTLPVTLDDLVKMKLEIIRVEDNRRRDNIDIPGNEHNTKPAHFAIPGVYSDYEYQKIKCDNGYERHPVAEDELDKLLFMLIPLGQSDTDPQTEKKLNEQLQYNPEVHTAEDVVTRSRGHNQLIGDTVFTNIFTCKHFDTVNRICGNYENRPGLCERFGHSCTYQGCGFVETMKALDNPCAAIELHTVDESKKIAEQIKQLEVAI
jgi:Fe-S-cluster containining protein